MQCKKNYVLILLFILSVFLITACDDNDDNNGGNNAGGEQLQMVKVIMNDNTRYALLSDKTLFSWASNENGLLGTGNNDFGSEKPVYVDNIMENIKEVFTNSGRTYVLTDNNSLYAWGSNSYGRLGVGDTDNRNTPTKVDGIDGIIKNIYTDTYSAYTLTEEGSLYTWGYNHNGQLGLGSRVQHLDKPTKVSGIDGVIKEIYTKNFSVYALTENGSLYAWGYNAHGQLGVGDTSDKRAPTKVNGIDGKIKQIYYGLAIYALTEDGSLYAWGDNQNQQLGIESTETFSDKPVKISGINGVIKEIYTNGSSIFVLTEDNSLYAWGYNDRGRLGVGLDDMNISKPTKVNGIDGIIKNIYTDYSISTYALTEDGSLYAWGDNQYGHLGINSNEEYINSPRKVNGINGIIKNIHTDSMSTYALTIDGSLYTWGDNRYGQLGLGNTQQINTPAKVSSINGTIKEIYTDDSSIFALTADGSLYTWGGENRYGQLGLGNTQQINTPAKVNGINGTINKIYTGISVYVLTNDNSLYSFGYDNFVVDGVSHTGLLGRDGLNTEPHKILFEK